MDFRKPFIDRLTELAKDNKDIAFITMDVGFSFLDPLKNVLGDRFMNFGITECSSIGAAAGMAKEGMKVYVYSMIPFVLFRPYEQVRNLVALSNLDVKLLGVSGSAAYSFLGFSHNMISENEDIDCLKNMKNMTAFIPKDEIEARKLADMTINKFGPTYIRL